MSDYTATIQWLRKDQVFSDNNYSRAHTWEFDGGLSVPASASPQVVPLPMSDASALDPEEAFVAALASCHMLFFLSLAAKKGFVVDSYEDRAAGTLGQDPRGKTSMTRVVLQPRVRFAGNAPAGDALQALHERAHELCFIANSVHTEVLIKTVA